MLFDEVRAIYAGQDGQSVVSYKPNGREVVFAGVNDTGFKVFEIQKEDQEHMSTDIQDQNELHVTCLSTSTSGSVAVGSVDGHVVLYRPDHSLDKMLVRSAVPVRSLSFHPSGNKLAIATDDHMIRIVLAADNSKIVMLEGHTSPLKSVHYNHNGTHLISSDIEGDIRIWDVSNTKPVPECIKTLKAYGYNVPPDAISQSTVAWHPDGSCFAFPGRDRDVRVFKTGLWSPFFTLQGEHTSQVITIAWSPNGYYLASSAEDNSVVVWDTKQKRAVRSEITSSPVTSLAWNPRENELTMSDTYGQLRVWKDVIPTDNSQYPHPALLAQTIKKELTQPHKSQPRQSQSVKMESSQPIYAGNSLAVDDEALDGADDMSLGDPLDMDDEGQALEDVLEEEGEDLGDFVIDDDGAGYAEQETEQRPKPTIERYAAADLQKQQLKFNSAFEPPTPFQPGETPYHKPEPGKGFDPAPGERRYMAYNLTGAISTIFEGHHSVINVEFHDQTEHRNFHFTDMQNFSLGALSASGTVFAVEGKEAPKKSRHEREDEDNDDDEEEEDGKEQKLGTLSALYYRPNTWGTDKDWTQHMLPGEDIMNVAINRISVIVTTSLGYVRIFSISGIQRHLFSLENVACISAMTDLALIVYAVGPSFKHQHNLHYLLLNTDNFEVIQKDKLQLSSDSQLNWIGFSETNQAATYDSAGVLRVLHRQRRPYQATWVPVFDSKAYAGERTEKYWPVGVLRDRFVCVVLRGQNMYPFFPRPPVKDLPLQLPLLDTHMEVGALEEKVMRTHIGTLHERDEAEATNAIHEFGDTFLEADMEMDVALLKLINLACKSEKVSKALDLADLLHTGDSVDKAIRIASHHRLTHLAEKMTSLKESKFMHDHKEPSLADAFKSIPDIHTSSQTALHNDLAGLKPFDTSYKRSNTFDMEEDSFMDTQASKRAKGFAFSTR